MTNRPNIVLVTVDSLRADHCGFMGYERNTTPTLDAMASEGAVFENAIAPGPSTPESMPAIFTGQYPIESTWEGGSGLDRRRNRIRQHIETRHTLPERLSDRGYTTAAFTPNPFTSRHFGFDQGFDHFQDFMDESARGSLYQRMFQGFLEGSNLSSMARILANFWQREEVFKPWESYFDEVVDWVRRAAEPYFLWVFLMDVHNPYLSSSEYRTQPRWQEFQANFEFWRQSHETPFSGKTHDRLVTAYDDSVRYADAFLARLRTSISSEDTRLVVHGDHGEAFGEHGTYGHEPYLYRENVHTPLVVTQGESQSNGQPVELRALPDVLLDIADTSQVTAPSTRYALSDTRQGRRTAVYGEHFGYIYDERSGEESWILEPESESRDTPEVDRAAVRRLVTRRQQAYHEQRRVEAATETLQSNSSV